MTHEIAKLLLEKARTPQDRQKAIRLAMQLGMPLAEIEQYLDWLDLMSANPNQPPPGDQPDQT